MNADRRKFNQDGTTTRRTAQKIETQRSRRSQRKEGGREAAKDHEEKAKRMEPQINTDGHRYCAQLHEGSVSFVPSRERSFVKEMVLQSFAFICVHLCPSVVSSITLVEAAG
jgi:hypothetical protein